MPWVSNCLICRKPETIDHVFLFYWEGVYFWDVLKRTIKKELPLHSLGMRFLTVKKEDGLPFDLIMLLGLHCLWRARVAGDYCDPDSCPARVLFRESIAQYIDILKQQDFVPEWLSRVEPLMNLEEF